MGNSSLHDRKTWIGAGVVLAIIIAAASWFMLVSPELSAADSLHSQASAQRAQNLSMANNVAGLRANSAHLPTYIEQLKRAMTALPSDSGLAEFTRQANGLASSLHVSISGITVGMIAPALAVAPGAAPATGTTATDSTTPSTSTPSTTTSTAPVATPRAGATAGTLYAIPLTVTSQGTFKAQSKFLEGLRSAGPRYGLVTGVQFAPGAGAAEASIDGSDTMTVQVTVFSQPQSADELAQLHKLLSGDIGS